MLVQKRRGEGSLSLRHKNRVELQATLHSSIMTTCFAFGSIPPVAGPVLGEVTPPPDTACRVNSLLYLDTLSQLALNLRRWQGSICGRWPLRDDDKLS